MIHRVCLVTLDCCSNDPHQKLTLFDRTVDVIRPDVPVMALPVGSQVVLEAFCYYLGNGYRQKLVVYPVFDLRLFKPCLRWTAFSVLGSLDPHSLTEFITIGLKRAKRMVWMATRPNLIGWPHQESRHFDRLGHAPSS